MADSMISDLEILLEKEREILMKGGGEAVKLIARKLETARHAIKDRLPNTPDGSESQQMKATYQALVNLERIILNWINAGVKETDKKTALL